MLRYDLVVLGSGTAGQRPAYAARKAGWSVAMVETAAPGGTCANRGCDAKKPLVNAAAALAAARRLDGHGLAGDVGIRWPALMRFKQSFTAPIPQRTRGDLRDAGIELFESPAAFLDHRRLRIGDEEVEAGRVVIATGAVPRPLEIAGEALLTTSDGFLELAALPQRLAFLGGGYVSMEFAHAAARAGADCTVIERTACPMKHFERELADRLRRASEAAGITILCDHEVTGIDRRGDALIVRCGEDGRAIEADMVVHGAGRVPSLDGLDLEAGGVERDGGGVLVDEHFRSVSNKAVYACGDAASTPGAKLTPIAGMEAAAMTHNLLHGHERTVDYAGTATVVFTVPPLASVGPTEREARDRGLDVEVKSGDSAEWKINRQLGAEHAAYKTLVERGSGRVVAAHLLGPGAEELINLFALAVRLRLTAEQLKRVPYAYPTQCSHLGGML